MVSSANRKGLEVGGHIATYQSSASLYEVGFNHFFRGKDHPGGGDQVYIQGHASPGIYARAYLEGRLTEDRLDGFRQELSHGGKGHGLPSYPHPRLMPDFWEFPTVSMGLAAINAICRSRSGTSHRNGCFSSWRSSSSFDGGGFDMILSSAFDSSSF